MNPNTDVNVAKAEDQIEKFIEKMIEDGKKRPLVANIALVYEALVATGSLFLALSVVPALFKVRSLTAGFDGFDDAFTASFSSNIIISAVLAILAFGLQALATHGLYHMRRYGIFALAGEGVLSLVALGMVGAVGFGFVIPGVLFYFLWKDRKKFA